MRNRSLLYPVLLLVAAAPQAQFTKHVDEHGHVTYTEDPGYDYGDDQPSDSEYRAALERQRQLEEWLDSRQAEPGPAPRSPAVSIRRRTHCQRVTSTLCDRR